MKEIKRAVCLMLCFVMVFGLLPVHANALDLDVSELQPGEFVEEIIAGDALEEPEEGAPAELAANTDTGNLPGGTNYVLDANAPVDGGTYLIVSGNSGTAYALRNNNGKVAAQSVSIDNENIDSVDTSCAWTFTANGSNWTIGNGTGNTARKIRLNNDNIFDANGQALTVYHAGDGKYKIYTTVTEGRWPNQTTSTYYLNIAQTTWQRSKTESYVYLFKQVTAEGTSVDFTVTPASKALKPGETLNLNTLIELENGTEVTSSNITWTSSDANIASVSNGVVTAKADGTATITAKLNSVNGLALSKPIEVNVTITVTTRTVTSGKLMGDTHVTTKLNVEPVFSGIKLRVTYNDGSTADITTANGLVITGYDITKIGSSYAKVLYNGVEYGTVRVTVDGNPYAGLDEATVYPEYPADGAVRIDKFATELDFASTGLVQVELDVAGVSVKTGVDVVLVVDVSNSMGWSLENAGNSQDADRIADVGQTNKLEMAMDAASSFADIFLADNSGNIKTDNTLSFVTFAGYDSTFGKDSKDSDVVDSLMEVFQRENSAEDAKRSFNGTTFEVGTGDTGNYHLTVTDNNGKVLVDGSNRGDTNYDYAFWQANQTVTAIKNANKANGNESREVYVIFMTDGAPSHYNHNNKQGASGRDDRVPSNINTSYKKDNNYDTNQDTWYNYFSSNANTYAKELYTAVSGNLMAIGFDLSHGGFGVNGTTWQWTEAQLKASLEQVAHDDNKIDVHVTAQKEELLKIYADLATELRYAGTQAEVADVIDPDFTLQMSNFTGTAGQGIGQVNIAEKGYTPSITIKTYDLYSKTETNDPALIGTRKGTYQDIETVTFNADGTEAYIRTGSGTEEDPFVYSENIMSTVDGVLTIEALCFTYTKTPEGVETFKWNIGNITDKEIALSYFAYLNGSLEGKEPDGLKYTNEGATLDYIDINGDHAQQIFPIPAVAWGGASTSYEFYLVNDDGKPCDRNGNVIPFANRIIITGPYFQELYLNQSDEEIAQEIIAVKVLPAGYTLYDETAKYEVQTASGDNDGYLKINDPGYGMITSDDPYNGPRYDKVTNADGTVSYVVSENGAYKKLDYQTTIRVFPEADSEDTSFIQSRVAFGVIYNMIPSESTFVIAPDAVVIDYGKEIIIDVNSNNKEIPSDVTATLIGFSKFYDDIDVEQQFSNTPYSTPFEGTYGTFSITADNKVSYVPHKLVNNVGKIFCVYRLTKGTDAYYMVSELDVIPATIMYYETDFATGVFTTNTTWETKNEGAAADGPQNDGTIGQNTYGFDSTYNNDAYLSNGSSLFVNGQGYDDAQKSKTYATFSFTGTGFDLISRTGENQGLIKVQVFTDAKMTTVKKTVSVLNKSESELELYQIPVVSINDLPHSTYYVKVEVDAAFTNTILPALNRGNEFYFDAIRIYDPAKGNAIAEAAYNADGEANNELDEVRAMLLNAETYATIQGVTTGMVFIDHTQTDVSVADYASIGPNNEVYLSKNQAVAFKVNANSIPASFDIGAKSITGSTAGLKVTVRNANGSRAWTVQKSIASSTVQFIDLFNADNITAGSIDKSLIFDNENAYVVITNTGDGVLSITDLKTAFSVGVASVEVDAITGVATMSNGKMETSDAVKPVEPFCVSYTVDAYTLDVARMVLTGNEEPEVPEVPETPEKPETPDVDPSFYNIQNVLIKINGSVKNQKCTFTVVTSQKVEDIEIVQNGAELMPARSSFKDKKSGERVWTIELRIGTYDKNGIFSLTGIGENGVRGASVTVNNMKNR